MTPQKDILLERSSDPVAVPKRVALVQRHDSLRVELEPEEMVMTVPHLVLREVIALQFLIGALATYSLLFDAPLEQLANPLKTPNPAKAPWYFLGLQELLHYFPPIVAGVLAPLLVLLSLSVIPYFNVNVRRKRLWDRRDRSTFVSFGVTVILLLSFLTAFGVWPVVVPTFAVGACMTVCFAYPRQKGWWGRVCELSLPAWVMIWFVTCATTLTLIGVYFRGPGWSWVMPWQ
jgi:hypothetical protein